MFRVNFLLYEYPGFYEYCILPVVINKAMLYDRGIDVKVFTRETNSLFGGDCLFFSSTYAKELGKNGATGEEVTDKTFELLEKMKKRAGKVFYFDNADSTSAYGQFRYLPYVDKYLKPWLLKNKKLYQRKFYRDRIFTDYYHSRHKVNDKKDSPFRVLPDDKDLDKIQLAWNACYTDYGMAGNLRRKVSKYISLPLFYSSRFTKPQKDRPIDINMRFNAQYKTNTIGCQRQMVKEVGERMRVPSGKVSRQQYYRELRKSKVAVSPFGYGEVCFRDFEIIISGAALIKPDMSHMETWPDLYIPEETYLPFNWDCTDLEEVLDRTLSNDDSRAIAQQAQSVYRKFLFKKEGREEFCEHFNEIVRK